MAAELHPPRASPNQLPKPLPTNIGSRTAGPATRWAFNPRLALPTTTAMVKFAAPEAPNWAQRRIASTNPHTMSTGTK